MKGYLKENDIQVKDGSDVNSIMRDMMSILLEGDLEEIDQEIGYLKTTTATKLLAIVVTQDMEGKSSS